MREESRAVIGRYKRRTRTYSPLDPAVFMSRQEIERELIRWLVNTGFGRSKDFRLLEIGCGTGGNLLTLIRLGIEPFMLIGNELQSGLISEARRRLPDEVALVEGDALEMSFESESLDVVFQSLVFSSLLDDAFQSDLAQMMWNVVKPGGGVLWYDMAFDNPVNPDVRGVKKKRIQELFPKGDIAARRVSLAPPLSRGFARIHPALYSMLNFLPFLRTHYFCWIRKPR